MCSLPEVDVPLIVGIYAVGSRHRNSSKQSKSLMYKFRFGGMPEEYDFGYGSSDHW